MALIRPRLTDHYGVSLTQAEADFAIPFLDEDLPLYVDPFLLWKSPSLQDQSLHGMVLTAFNRTGWLSKKGRADEAANLLVRLSECDEVGLGSSATRKGKRIGPTTASEIVRLFDMIQAYDQRGFLHFEEIQLYVDGISKDRISDFSANLLKSFLIDYTIHQCDISGLPRNDVTVAECYDHQKHIVTPVRASLPVHPISGRPLLLVPKRWLRYSPWICFDDYFKHHIPKDDKHGAVIWDRVSVLTFNRDNYGAVEEYVKLKERQSEDCKNDPLFSQIPLLSAKRKLSEIRALPSGKTANADKRYEDAVATLLASMFYPQLDFAQTQVRTDSGAQIRDLIFYMNRNVDFLGDVHREYGCRQIVFELKNVAKVERDHINQLNRYLAGDFGRFGVMVTRNPLPKAMRKNTIDLWSGQRRCLLPITDEDLSVMVDLFEEGRRPPLDVLKRSFVQFTRECPS